MCGLYGDPSHPLPFMNDIQEDQMRFPQVIQFSYKAVNDLEPRELRGILQDPSPSVPLGVAIPHDVEETLFLNKSPEVVLRKYNISKHQLAPP